MLADPAIQSRLPLGRNKQISIYLSIYLSIDFAFNPLYHAFRPRNNFKDIINAHCTLHIIKLMSVLCPLCIMHYIKQYFYVTNLFFCSSFLLHSLEHPFVLCTQSEPESVQ